jgi:hypothetical protein
MYPRDGCRRPALVALFLALLLGAVAATNIRVRGQNVANSLADSALIARGELLFSASFTPGQGLGPPLQPYLLLRLPLYPYDGRHGYGRGRYGHASRTTDAHGLRPL